MSYCVSGDEMIMRARGGNVWAWKWMEWIECVLRVDAMHAPCDVNRLSYIGCLHVLIYSFSPSNALTGAGLEEGIKWLEGHLPS